MIKQKERRKHKRFRADDGAFAVLRRPWPHPTTLGRIEDINMYGVAFDYTAGEEPPHRSAELEILWNDCSFRLKKVPSKTVSDSVTAIRGRFSSLEMRRRSMRFRKLTPYQKSQLQYFINNYTTFYRP